MKMSNAVRIYYHDIKSQNQLHCYFLLTIQIYLIDLIPVSLHTKWE